MNVGSGGTAAPAAAAGGAAATGGAAEAAPAEEAKEEGTFHTKSKSYRMDNPCLRLDFRIPTLDHG